MDKMMLKTLPAKKFPVPTFAVIWFADDDCQH